MLDTPKTLIFTERPTLKAHNMLIPRLLQPGPLSDGAVPTHFESLSISPPQLPATTNLLSVSMSLPVLDISYKWSHRACSPRARVLSLSLMSSMEKAMAPHSSNRLQHSINIYMRWETKKFTWLTLLKYLLSFSGLEPSLHYL